MKRALSLYLPMWSIDRVRRRMRAERDERQRQEAGSRRQASFPPLLLVTTTADRQLVAQCCEQSRAAGVRPGMTLAHARALLPTRATKGPSDQGTKGRNRAQGAARVSTPGSLGRLVPRSLPFTPRADAIALRRLARWCMRFCPTVAPDPELDELVHASNFDLLTSHFPLHAGLLMDITGCDRLYRGEHNLAQAVADAMYRLGFACRVAIASTFGAAWAMARFADAREHHPDRVVPRPHEQVRQPTHQNTERPEHHPVGMVLPESASLREALRDLPVRALRIEPKIQDALAEVAIDRVGHLYDLPRSQLPSRFGDALLLRLDQALGQAIETIDPVRPEPPPHVEIEFNGPTTQVEAIELASRQLVEQLIGELQSREAGVRELVLTLTRVEMEPAIVRVTFTHPTRDVKHLWSLLRPQLEKAHLGHGVDRVSLTAQRWGRLSHEQRTIKPAKPTHSRAWVPGAPKTTMPSTTPLRLTSDDHPPLDPRHEPDPLPPSELAAHRGQLLDTLLNRLGPPRVLQMQPVATHMPWNAFRFQPAGEVEEDEALPRGLPATRHKNQRRGTKRHRDERRHTASGFDPSSLPFPLPDRPSLLFDRPEPARVMAVTPDGPPVQLRWRGCDLRVIWSAGPLRLGGEWWRRRHIGTKARRHEGEEAAENSVPSCRRAAVPLTLDFFRLACDDGQWLWVSRQWPAQAWHVWGMWV